MTVRLGGTSDGSDWTGLILGDVPPEAETYGIGCTERWYEHVPNRVSTDKDGQVVIYWDVTVETEKALPHNRPDVVVVDKRVGKWTLVDFSVPLDKNVVSKEDE